MGDNQPQIRIIFKSNGKGELTAMYSTNAKLNIYYQPIASKYLPTIRNTIRNHPYLIKYEKDGTIIEVDDIEKFNQACANEQAHCQYANLIQKEPNISKKVKRRNFFTTLRELLVS